MSRTSSKQKPVKAVTRRGKARTQVRVKAVRPKRRRKPLTWDALGRLDKSAVILLIWIYCLAHWVVRTLIAPVYTVEEAEQLLMSQSLQLGYDAAHPPLLAWIFATLKMWPGLSPPLVFGVKYLLLFSGLTLFYLAARNVLVRPGVSAAAVACWAMTFYIGWGAHEDLLNTVALMACLSMTLHAMTRILTWRRPRDWIYLGVAMGLGLLTSYLYIVFPVALLLAAALSSFFRDALNPLRLLLSLAVALAVFSPFGVWLATHTDDLRRAVQEYMIGWQLEPEWLIRAERGAISFGRSLLEFSLPVSMLWAFLFWPLWLPILYPMFDRRSTEEEPHERAWRTLAATTVLIAAGLFAIAVLAGVQRFKGAWMAPVLFLGPIWMFAHVKRAGEFPIAIRAHAATAILLIALVFAGRFVEWRGELTACDEDGCRPYTPVQQWAEAIADAGFVSGTIVGADPHLTGNLMAEFPEARVLDAGLSPEAFPPPAGRGACLAVWRNSDMMPQALSDYLVISLETRPRGTEPQGAVRRYFRGSYDKAATLYYRFIPPSGKCR